MIIFADADSLKIKPEMKNSIIIGMIHLLISVSVVKGQGNSDKVSQSPLPSRATIFSLSNKTEEKEYSSTFITEADIAVRQIHTKEYPVLEQRLAGILLAAFKESTIAHLRQNRTFIMMTPNKNENPFVVEILGTINTKGLTKLSFVSFFDNQPVPSEVIVKDISLLTLSHLSAVLQYPVIDIRAQYETERNEQPLYWLLGIILGSGALIALCGWCCLFLYFNTCGRPVSKYHPTRDGNQPASEVDHVKEIEKQPKHVQFQEPRWATPTSKILEYNSKGDVNEKTEVVAVVPPPLITVDEGEPQQPQSLPQAQQQSPELLESEAVGIPVTPGEAKHETTSEKPLVDTSKDFQLSVIERPKSAYASKRSSNDFLFPATFDRAWSPYQAGDFIAFTYGVHLGLAQYPRPLPSSGNGGVIEMVSGNTKQHLNI